MRDLPIDLFAFYFGFLNFQLLALSFLILNFWVSGFAFFELGFGFELKLGFGVLVLPSLWS